MPLNLKHKKILLTGGAGFLGKYVERELIRQGATPDKIVIPRKESDDLRDRTNCARLTVGMDIVIHLAANGGGIGKNRLYPGTMFYDNAVMGIELIEAARQNKVKKFVLIGTVCYYPKYTPIPFKEEFLWDGYPEETNAAYGLAKKILLVQAQAYRSEFGFNAITLMPVNLYGPHDNFHPASSHVIPSLIRKIFAAKKSKKPTVTVWGTGNATREFLFVADAARGIVLALVHYSKAEPVNLAGSGEVSIRELANLISQKLEYRGKIVWDTTKPDGQPRRKADGTKAYKEFGFVPETAFSEGLNQTIDWYVESHKGM